MLSILLSNSLSVHFDDYTSHRKTIVRTITRLFTIKSNNFKLWGLFLEVVEKAMCKGCTKTLICVSGMEAGRICCGIERSDMCPPWSHAMR
jgi:hypothetical protein